MKPEKAIEILKRQREQIPAIQNEITQVLTYGKETLRPPYQKYLVKSQITKKNLAQFDTL